MELTEGGLLKTLRFVIVHCDSYKTLPFKWNSSKGGSIALKKKSALAIYRKWTCFVCVCITLILLQVVWTWDRASLFVKSLSLEFFSAVIMTFPSCYLNTKSPGAVAAFANKMIAFENNQRGKRPGLDNTNVNDIIGENGRRWTKWITKLCVVSIFSMLPFQLNAIVEPCFPVYFGFWLSQPCRAKLGPIKWKMTTWTWTEVITRIGLFMLSYINWSFLVPSGIVHISLMMLQGHCLRSYMRYYTACLNSNVNKDKTSQLNYQTFREIQLLSVEYRDIYSGLVLASIASGGMFVQMATLYISIDLIRKGEVADQLGMMLACTWVTVGVAMIIVFIYGTLADVYSVSFDEYGKIRSRGELMRDKLFRRFFRSCPVIRVYLAGDNFLEPETPLNIEHSVVEQTTDFLLM